MWPFTNRASRADITARDLKEEFAELRGEVRALQMEWDRTYDKLRGIVARMSRRNGEIEDPAATPAAPGKAVPQVVREPSRTPLLTAARRNY